MVRSFWLLCVLVLVSFIWGLAPVAAVADDDEKKEPAAAEEKPLEILKGAATRIDKMKFDLTPLKKWGKLRYKVVENRKKDDTRELGHVVLETTVDEETVTMDDAGRIGSAPEDDKPWIFDWHAEARPDALLGLKSLDFSSGGDLEEKTVLGTWEKGKVKFKTTAKGMVTEKELPWPADTVSDFALSRIMVLLPQDKDKIYEVGHVWDRPVSFYIKGTHRIVCRGPDKENGFWIRFDLYDVTKKGERVLPNEKLPAAQEADIIEEEEDEADHLDEAKLTPLQTYWVSKERVLKKVDHGQGTWVLILEPAKKATEPEPAKP